MRRLLAALVIVLGSAGGSAWASAGSARDLRNAQHYYQVGRYERAKGYFLSVLANGSEHEKAIARHFLNLTTLRNVTAQKPQRRPAPVPAKAPPPEEEWRGEAETAPERTAPAAAASAFEPMKLSGYIRNETAFRISEPGQLSKMRTLALVAGTGQLTESLSYKISGRLFYDAVFDLTHRYPDAVRDDERTDASLRDTYLDYSKGNWDVRAGRQQIVWGEAVGLFYADVVNAKDLREFVLPDFDFIRIPQWSTDVEYTRDAFHAELVWLPILEFDKLGRPGSEFFPAIPAPGGVPLVWNAEQTPGDRLENGEIGGRFSYRANGWDTSVFHLRTWDQLPVFARTETPTAVVLNPFHPRLTVDGFTVAKEISDVVYKTEFVYNSPKYFLSTDPAAPQGLTQRDYLDYLFGADYTFDNNLSTDLQFSQRVIPHYTPALFGQRRYQSYLTLLLRRPFHDNKITPEILVLKALDSTDAMLRPKVTFKLSGSWRLTTGFDLFGGPPSGLFGEFADRNRAYGELRYDF